MKHELGDQGPRMMFLLGLLLSLTESDGNVMTDARRQFAHCFPVALFLACHDAKIPPIRSYRHFVQNVPYKLPLKYSSKHVSTRSLYRLKRMVV
jgi:hypothetical protein